MLVDNTDVFITSDHGFATVSRGAIDPSGTRCESFATQQRYRNVPEGELPLGFLAIDLAHDLNLPLFDSVQSQKDSAMPGRLIYKQLKIDSSDGSLAEFPSSGSGMLGGGVFDKDGLTASIIVANNGGTDQIYFPPPRLRAGSERISQTELAKKVVASVITKQYISAVFVDAERFGPIPGALAFSDINLRSSARTPAPAIVVSFRSFSTDPAHPETTGVEIADANYRTGAGIHGSFGRHVTFNNMMAIGPDFKTQFADTDPVSNADIAMTLSKILDIDLAGRSRGGLRGRVLSEATTNGSSLRGAERKQKDAAPADNGAFTRLNYQLYTDENGRQHFYCDAAGIPGTAVGVPK
jgi:hypothetical protein